MMRPSSFAVFALKFLQKSMMFRPCGPSAVPTGGAGVALPAAIWSFTCACTFLAISELLYLQKVQLDRRGAAENRHHDLQRVAVGVHVIDQAVEARERTFVDPHLIAALEAVLRLRLLGGDRHLMQDLVDFLARQRRRLRAGADEAGHLGRVLDDMPCV